MGERPRRLPRGLGVLVIWAAIEVLVLCWGRRDRASFARSLNVLAVVAASLVAVCLNPFGVELLRFLHRTALVPRPEIWEWQPLTLASEIGALYAIVLGLAGFGLGAGRRRPSAPLLAVLVVALIMPLFGVRHIAPAALAVAVIACEAIDDAWDRVRGDRWAKAWTAALGPRIKVSVDGRREALYDGPEYRDNLRFMFGTGEWDALLTRYDTHLALVATSRPVFNLMKLQPGWSLLYEDPLSALFGKDGLPILDPIRRTSLPPVPYNGAGLCFP